MMRNDRAVVRFSFLSIPRIVRKIDREWSTPGIFFGVHKLFRSAGPPLLYKSSAHCHKRRVPSDWARACRDWLVQSPNRTATRVPTRPVVDSLCCGKATPVETCHRHVSKSRLSNPFHLTPKKNRYSNEYRFFWWKVVDSNHRSHRRQIYSLFPLATRETFHIQLPA